MVFKVGETVVYPHHGAALIEAIETRTIKGEEKKYLVLKVAQGDLTVRVPADNAEIVGVRDVVGQEGLDRVFEVLRAPHTEEPTNWSRRYKANLEKLASGDVNKVAEVVRDLWRREKDRGLSAGEKRMLAKARQNPGQRARARRGHRRGGGGVAPRPGARFLTPPTTVSSRRVVAIVPAAGSGERLGAGRPKALVAVAGVPMVVRAVDGLLSSGVVDDVVVVAPVDHLAETAAVLPAPARVVAGGADRVASVALGLAAVRDADVVLVHDAARCLCPGDVARAVVAAVRDGHGAVIPALPVADTVRRVDPGGRVVDLVDRTGLLAVQTPQGFRPDVLRRAHEAAVGSSAAARATDDAGLVEALGGEVVTVPGDPRAFKITTPLDLAMAEALLGAAAPALVSGDP